MCENLICVYTSGLWIAGGLWKGDRLIIRLNLSATQEALSCFQQPNLHIFMITPTMTLPAFIYIFVHLCIYLYMDNNTSAVHWHPQQTKCFSSSYRGLWCKKVFYGMEAFVSDLMIGILTSLVNRLWVGLLAARPGGQSMTSSALVCTPHEFLCIYELTSWSFNQQWRQAVARRWVPTATGWYRFMLIYFDPAQIWHITVQHCKLQRVIIGLVLLLWMNYISLTVEHSW